jgi:uncharacterized protein YndB with AHSA1/START domain
MPRENVADKIQHATLTLERSYSAPVERVFSAFADPIARAQWSPASGDVFIYDEADFREGGRDRFRCGPKGDARFHGETTYHLIVENKLVISSETVETDGQRLAVSLNTLHLEPGGDGTKLRLTVQMVSLMGEGMIAGYEAGNKGALENLARYLNAKP